MSKNNKERGNTFERTVARDMSLWLFNNKKLLRRSADSGAQKVNYGGDIIPEGQLPSKWNGKWPFIIECKYGYKEIAIPNIWNKKWIETWFLKSLEESKIHNQNIIFIINNFKNRKFNTLTTDIFLNNKYILHEISFPIIINGYVKHLFVYNYKTILKIDIEKIIPNFFERFCK